MSSGVTKKEEDVVVGMDTSEGDVDAAMADNNNKPSSSMFALKKWNAVAMWSWDVECDTCAICRVQVMDSCLRCQGDTSSSGKSKADCVVVWGECNHSFHHCCMSMWVQQNRRCPLCQKDWSVQRMGK